LAHFLIIDTSSEKALIGIGKGELILAQRQNAEAQSHANFVQVAIEECGKEIGISLAALDAIVVTMGPGSYTGLRVGLASAKGMAFALNKPLIGLSALELLATAAQQTDAGKNLAKEGHIFSMIDAKRMEVFGAIYTPSLQIVEKEQPIILSMAYMQQWSKTPLLCIGSGVAKTQTNFETENVHYLTENYTLTHCLTLANQKWAQKEFEDLAYSSPSYLKDFYQKPAESKK
jgi:tRNA threonylcarbamoyladenosine biosynthesis protein TsaB